MEERRYEAKVDLGNSVKKKNGNSHGVLEDGYVTVDVDPPPWFG